MMRNPGSCGRNFSPGSQLFPPGSGVESNSQTPLRDFDDANDNIQDKGWHFSLSAQLL
jgi:hypothetical protein